MNLMATTLNTRALAGAVECELNDRAAALLVDQINSLPFIRSELSRDLDGDSPVDNRLLILCAKPTKKSFQLLEYFLGEMSCNTCLIDRIAPGTELEIDGPAELDLEADFKSRTLTLTYTFTATLLGKEVPCEIQLCVK